MILNLLNFFEDTTTTTDASATDNGNIFTNGSWVTILVFGLLIVAMVLMIVIPNRRQKKQTEDMMSKLAVGSVVTTIGGIVGTVVQLDEKYIWLETGTDGSKNTMQFVRQAIHSVSPAPDSAEGKAETAAETKEDNETDEIK